MDEHHVNAVVVRVFCTVGSAFYTVDSCIGAGLSAFGVVCTGSGIAPSDAEGLVVHVQATVRGGKYPTVTDVGASADLGAVVFALEPDFYNGGVIGVLATYDCLGCGSVQPDGCDSERAGGGEELLETSHCFSMMKILYDWCPLFSAGSKYSTLIFIY